ncbi:MAG TPA: hypothetical protein VFS08_05195 [Gemmatimonadaceae bacterium]|nr:hypothetical protein [Gemmatimonadaceae bacterium]
MIARLWPVLLCVLGLALPSASPAMGALRRVSAAATAPTAVPVTIHADNDLPTSYLQPSELAELLAKLERALSESATGVVPLADSELPCVAPGAPRGARAADDRTRWCDVVQCRRVSGARLLRYATPPPVRG